MAVTRDELATTLHRLSNYVECRLTELLPQLLALRDIRSPSREVVFELTFDDSVFYSRYRKLIESAGLKYVKRQTKPQQMRRSFASHLEALGGNATKALRHSDRRVTDRSYLDPKVVDSQPDNERLFPLDGENGEVA
jgi:integrase